MEKDESKLGERLIDGIDVVIFDMDGTLYRLDGEDGKFGGSRT